MRHAPTLLLLLLVGCGEPETVTQPESPVLEQADVASMQDATTTEVATLNGGSFHPGANPKNQPVLYLTLGQLTGKVIKVIDGDIIDVLNNDKETIRIRLNGIDCPERGQPFGINATDFLSERLGGKLVRIESHGEDKYGRTIGDVYLPFDSETADLVEKHGWTPFKNGVDIHSIPVNSELVATGLAWHCIKYAPDRPDLADAEKTAREEKRGLWSGSHEPIPPWDWRRMSKDERDQYR